MKLNFQRIFDNLIFKYPISKTFLEYIGYISSYLPKLEYGQWVKTSTPDTKIFDSNPKDMVSWAL